MGNYILNLFKVITVGIVEVVHDKISCWSGLCVLTSCLVIVVDIGVFLKQNRLVHSEWQHPN